MGRLLRQILRGPRASWLWALTVAVALLGAAVEKQPVIEKWLKAHDLEWLGSPLGIPLIWWWAVLFMLNEIWVRLAGEEARKDWVGRQRHIWAKFGANLDELNASLRNGGGEITESNSKGTVRSFLARAVDLTSFILDKPGDEFSACVLVVVSRRP